MHAPSNRTTVLFTAFPGVSVPLFEALSNLRSIRRAEKQLFSGILLSNHVLMDDKRRLHLLLSVFSADRY